MRTTQEWEALLDGASKTPWVANPHGNIFASVDGRKPEMDEPYDPQREIVIGRFDAHHVDRDVLNPANSKLAAVAPEAVAEVVRLRREMEELRDEIQGRALTQRRNRELVAAVAGHETAKKITRILNPKENQQ